MRNLILALFISSLYTSVNAQGFHLPETKISFLKDISFGTVHGYLEIQSDSVDTIPMTWVARKSPEFPPEWDVNFDDQNNYYFPITHHDSAQFDLYPNQSFAQKLIIGLAHNAVADTESIYFTIIPNHAPEDSVRIEYEFLIARELPEDTLNPNDSTDTTSSIWQIPNRDFKVFHNGNQWCFESQKKHESVVVVDIEGIILWQGTNVRSTYFDPHWNQHLVLVIVRDGHRKMVMKVGR